ncbi:MAG: ABC transporter permease, partial [Pseudomonadota bacterium]
MTDQQVQTSVEATPGVREASGADQEPRSQWLDVWDQFKHHSGAFWGMVVFFSIVFLVLIGPFIYWH